MFIHQAGPQALVQYSILYDCIRAKGELEKLTYMLNGRRYSFEVQFSKLRELQIVKNNNYSRDFLLYPMEIIPSAGATSEVSPAALQSQGSMKSSNCTSPSLSSSGSNHDSLSTERDVPSYSPYSSLFSPNSSMRDSALRPSAPLYGRDLPPVSFMENEFGSRDYPLLPQPSLYRRDSDMSLLSAGSSLRRRDSDLSLLGTSFVRDPAPMMSSLHENHSLLNLLGSQQTMRRYVLEGFSRMMPISDLVDFLYGIDIKFAEYKSDFNGYSVVIHGRSDWSDTMLIGYLNRNPVDGKVIRLRESSEVTNY